MTQHEFPPTLQTTGDVQVMLPTGKRVKWINRANTLPLFPLLDFIFCANWCLLLPPANEVWGKVIFSEAFVKNSVHGEGAWYPSMHCRWYPSMPHRSPGPHLGGSWGVWPGGSPGPHPRGKLRGLAWGVFRPTAGEMATAVDGMHPTGMHSCYYWFKTCFWLNHFGNYLKHD